MMSVIRNSLIGRKPGSLATPTPSPQSENQNCIDASGVVAVHADLYVDVYVDAM